MPKKPSTLLVMQDYRPLSSRRWHKLAIDSVCRPDKANIRFELAVIDDSQQAGRTIVHNLPAVLAPNSPLCRFLADGFAVRPVKDQPLDLETIVGRCLLARFSKAVQGRNQEIIAVKPALESSVDAVPTKSAAKEEEPTDGLG